MAILKMLSIGDKGLRYKLMIAFSLMAIIPLLACVYMLSPHLVPESNNLIGFAAIIFISTAISILGLMVARNIIDAVIELASETKKISAGDYDRRVEFRGDDELGNLSQSINTMSMKIKLNLDELKKYGQNIKEINAEVEKKVRALSSLLQIDDAISTGTMEIDPFLEFAVGKASDVFDTGFGILYMPREEGGDYIARACYKVEQAGLRNIIIKRGGHGIFEEVLETQKALVAAGGMRLSKDLDEFKRAHGLKNFIALALYSDKAVFGILLLGNRLGDFSYTNDDLDLIAIFAKHITIGIESDLLKKRNRDLATTDDVTGLYNKRHILFRLEEEIKRAIFYQRPCAFAAFRINNFKGFSEANGEMAAQELLRRIAKIIVNNNIPIGSSARISVNEFAMLLPEKNKKEAARIAEDVRKKIENINALKVYKTDIVVSSGLSENPIDGATSDELFKKALASVKREDSDAA